MDLGNRIKNYRKENNLTQQDLADKLFVSRSLIAKWEQGRGLPTPDVLEKLADLMGVPFNELISEKDEKTVVLETNHNIKSQKGFFLLISILSCVILISVSAFFISYLNNQGGKNNDNSSTNVKPKVAYTYSYDIAEVDGENLYIKHKGQPFNFNATIPLDNSSELRTHVYTRDKNSVPLTYIRNGHKLKLYLAYYDYGVESSYENELINIESIYIIDDYLEGDNYIKGFFLSTIPYSGEKAPINEPEYGYEFDAEYNFNGTLIPLSSAFPYCFFVDGNQPNEFFCLSFYFPLNYDTKTREYTTPFGYVYKEVHNIPIILDANVQTLYVYALDDSQKGFFEYNKLTKEKNSTTLTAKRIQPKYYNQSRIAHSFEYELEIVAQFTGCSYVIQEYGVNHTPIKTTEGFYQPKLGNSGIFYLDEKTRSVEILFEDGRHSAWYLSGDIIQLPRLLYSGFVQYQYMHIL